MPEKWDRVLPENVIGGAGQVIVGIIPDTFGNGTVGRMRMNYYLMTHNYPSLIVYDEDKHLYYECLQKYDVTEELNPLYELFKYETEKTNVK